MDKDDWSGMLKCARVAQDNTPVDHLMLRYRPIAPKPVAGQPRVGHNSLHVTTKRTKRKYVRVCKNNNSGKRKIRSDGDKEIVTLQLLPERAGNPDEESPPSSSDDQERTVVDAIIGDKKEPSTRINLNGHDSADPTAEILWTGTGVVESWVTVESMTGGGFQTVGRTDFEIMDGLDKDASPCFVSDGSNRVVWVNDAYRNMVSGSDGGESPEIVVWLVVKLETTAFHMCKAFTCRVKLQYTWQKARFTKTVPCDAVRLEFGGFAWRLDTEAALGLGLCL